MRTANRACRPLAYGSFEGTGGTTFSVLGATIRLDWGSGVHPGNTI